MHRVWVLLLSPPHGGLVSRYAVELGKHKWRGAQLQWPLAEDGWRTVVQRVAAPAEAGVHAPRLGLSAGLPYGVVVVWCRGWWRWLWRAFRCGLHGLHPIALTCVHVLTLRFRHGICVPGLCGREEGKKRTRWPRFLGCPA